MPNIVSNFAFDFLNSLPISIVFLKKNFSFYSCNNFFCELTGYEKNELRKKTFKTICDFNISKKELATQNFNHFYNIEIHAKNSKIPKSYLLKCKLMNLFIYDENKEMEFIVLIIQNPRFVDLVDYKFIDWMQESKTKASLIFYTFEQGKGPVPKIVLDPSDTISLEDQTKLGFYLMTAIGQGTSHPHGLFGPLPCSIENQELNALTYATEIKDKEQTDKRTKGLKYTLITIIYPKMLESIILNRQRIRSIISNELTPIKDISELKNDFFCQMIDKIFFIDEIQSGLSGDKQKVLEQSIVDDLIEIKLNAIYELGKNLNKIYDLGKALEEIVSFCESTLDFKLITLFTVDKIKDELILTSFRGHTDLADVKDYRISVYSNKSVVSKTAQLKKLLNIPDVNAKEIDFYLKVNKEVNSEIAVPIIVNNELLGILDIESDLLNGFSAEDENFLLLLADMTGNVIIRHKFESYFAQINALTKKIIDTNDLKSACDLLTEFANRFLNFEVFAILDCTFRPKLKLISQFGYKNENIPEIDVDDDKFFISYVFRKKEPVFIDDLKNSELPYFNLNSSVTAEYVIPLILNGEVTMLINVETVRALDKTEKMFLEYLSNQLKLIMKIYFK